MNKLKQFLEGELGVLFGGTVSGVAMHNDEGQEYYGLKILSKRGTTYDLMFMMDPEGNGPGHYLLHASQPELIRKIRQLVWKMQEWSWERHVGKKIGRHLYIAWDAVPVWIRLELDMLLQKHRGTSDLVGTFNVIKLDTAAGREKITFLRYKHLLAADHPELESSSEVVEVNGNYSILTRRYAGQHNPPILHRKELLWFRPTKKDPTPKHPVTVPACWADWCALTKREEEAGLYENTKIIGTRNGWEKVCSAKGWKS